MLKGTHPAGLEEAAQRWKEIDVRSFLSPVAKATWSDDATGLPLRRQTPDASPIELAGGIPDPVRLPVEDFRESLNRVLASNAEEALRYGGAVGFDGLLAALAERQSRLEGIQMEPDNFIMTNGSGGAIDKILNAFLVPGDVVITEAPVWFGTLRILRGHLADIIQVPEDADGLRVDMTREAMERAEAQGKRVKMVFVNPDFHNPSGTLLSEQRKMDLIELCAEHQVLILEDAAYAEIYFEGQPPASLYAMAGGQGVLKTGTFSKIIATGLRVGWVQASPEFIHVLTGVSFEMGNSPLLHRAIADLMERGKLEPHVESMRQIYAEKCATLSKSLLEHCAPYVKFTKPQGGYFLWVECIGPTDEEVTSAGAEENLLFAAGSRFFVDGEKTDSRHIRLAFTTATLEELADVGPRLKRAFQRAIGER